MQAKNQNAVKRYRGGRLEEITGSSHAYSEASAERPEAAGWEDPVACALYIERADSSEPLGNSLH